MLLRKLTYWFFAGTLLCFTGLVHANVLNHYIVGGSIVSDDTQYPFMVSVYFDATGINEFEQGCGGTLIADRWILTAAHCLYNNDLNRPMSVERVGVLVGEKDLADGQDGNFVPVKRLIPHPEYDSETNRYDIGLIELLEPYDAPVAVLPRAGTPLPVLGEPGVVLGWGVTEELGAQSTQLREVTLPIASNAACFPVYQYQFDSRLAFCAGGSRLGGLDSCQGDSGGPLLVTRQSATSTTVNDSVYIVAGIVSYGDGCARPSIPGVYTRVEAFSEWIKSNTSGTLEYADQLDAAAVDNTPVTSLAVNTSISGQVLTGQVAYFDVSGAMQVNLTSLAGDADLFIIEDADFQDISADLLLCSSQEASAIDVCVIGSDQRGAYAFVYGYQDASYTISTQQVTSNPNTALPLESGTPVFAIDSGSGALVNSEASGGGGGALSKFLGMLILIVYMLRLRLSGSSPKPVEASKNT